MTGLAATSDTVCNGISDEDPQNVQKPIQESGTSYISELLEEQSVAWIKWAIDAPIWSGTRHTYQERIDLLMSSWTNAVQTPLTDLLKGNCSTIDHGETNTGAEPILGGISDGLEPIMPILSNHSNSGGDDLQSASPGATAPRINSSGRQRGTRGRKRLRIITSRIRRSGLGDDASLNSTTDSDDEDLRSKVIVSCTLINLRNGKEVPCRTLLDTGAGASVMKRSLANRIVGKGNFEPYDETDEVRGVGGKVNPVGKVTCILKLACSKSITTTFYVLEDEELAGLDICLSRSASVKTGHVIIPACRKCNRSTCGQ